MTLVNALQLENTKKKLAMLEELMKANRAGGGPNRDVEFRSLARLAKKLREEIILFEIASKRTAIQTAQPSNPLSRK